MNQFLYYLYLYRVMKLYLFIGVCLITLYLTMYKYKGIKTIPEIAKDNTELRKKDNYNFLNEEHSIVTTLNNIERSEKVTLKDVQEKWSLNKNTIDAKLNLKVISFISKTINTLGILHMKDYYIHTIENIYVMKDSDKNFRMVGDVFMYDIRSFFTFRIVFDFVSFKDNVYINYIDIDESSTNNILDRYNVKWNSQGILDNFHNFDMNVISLLNNHYQMNTSLLQLSGKTKESSLEKTTRLSKFYSDPNNPSVEFPIFCKKHTSNWGYGGYYLPSSNECMFHNPYSSPYPNDPYDAPGVVTHRVDSNEYEWMFEPEM